MINKFKIFFTNHHKKCISLLSLVALINLYFSFINNFYYANGDSAIVVDLVNNLGNSNQFRSFFAESLYHLRPYFTATIDQYCSLNLHNPNYIADFIKHEHSYLIAVLLSFFVKMGIEALKVVSFFFSINFILIFITIYFFLKNKISNFILYLFIIAIILWPPISVGFFGQFYFDRLYILPMFLLILTYYNYNNTKNKNLFTLIFFLAFYTSLVHERAALMVGFFLCIYSLLITNFKIYKNKKVLVIFFLGMTAIVYFLFYTKFYLISNYTSQYSITSITSQFSRIFFDSNYRFLSLKLFLINLPILLICLFDKKLFFLALCSLLPNFLITIGGAEKTGLSTHYHAYYIPFLMASSVIGIKKIYEREFFFKFKKSTYIFLIIIILFNNSHDYTNKEKFLSFSKFAPGLQNFYSSILYPLDYERRNFYNKNLIQIKQSIQISIPVGSSVDMDESMMPYFAAKEYKVNFFPLGVGSSQYLIVPFNENYKLNYFFFQNKKDSEKIENCLIKKINKSYKKVEEFNFWHKGKYILYVLK